MRRRAPMIAVAATICSLGATAASGDLILPKKRELGVVGVPSRLHAVG